MARSAARAAAALALAGAALLGTAGFTAAGTAGPGPVSPENAEIAAYAQTFVGEYPYRWGGDSPATGFDCSGLTSYIYQQFGMVIPRTAEAQFRFVRRETAAQAQPGDLVFFHGRHGYVYHVGIYEGARLTGVGTLVAAADPQEGIIVETIWTARVTFGTLTH
ncbi:MAG TPA: NlpC/P60 family protein [Streptosporangiaceae bacterium]